ncbi:MAG: Riboflavin synthase alpha chain, partial [Phylliscum demangeonii]
MFTGLVEIIGTDGVLDEATRVGDSINVNGTCLTITSFQLGPPSAQFTVELAPETLRRTNLGSLHAAGTSDPPSASAPSSSSSQVNLERAVTSTSRMGGHFVQGHVDTTATILATKADGAALTVRLRPRAPAVLTYVVEKGYVALDGASLTVTAVHDDDDDAERWFEVMLIPYTRQKIVLGRKGPGDEVNLEVDMLAKYVDNLMLIGLFLLCPAVLAAPTSGDDDIYAEAPDAPSLVLPAPHPSLADWREFLDGPRPGRNPESHRPVGECLAGYWTYLGRQTVRDNSRFNEARPRIDFTRRARFLTTLRDLTEVFPRKKCLKDWTTRKEMCYDKLIDK